MSNTQTDIEDPDWMDINDWLVFFHPEIADALHYIQVASAYTCGLIYWREQGCPDICAMLDSRLS